MNRFWSKVNKNGSQVSGMAGRCWEWVACKNQGGYGKFRLQERMRSAHIVSYEMARGPVPPGKELDHLCRNRACVNPDHLEPVTHEVNVRRGRGGQNRAAKTHCPQGHAYDEANTRINVAGARECRMCNREKAARYRRKSILGGGK
jgi:hypothetical protein